LEEVISTINHFWPIINSTIGHSVCATRQQSCWRLPTLFLLIIVQVFILIIPQSASPSILLIKDVTKHQVKTFKSPIIQPCKIILVRHFLVIFNVGIIQLHKLKDKYSSTLVGSLFELIASGPEIC
jgi:hypothetical protein